MEHGNNPLVNSYIQNNIETTIDSKVLVHTYVADVPITCGARVFEAKVDYVVLASQINNGINLMHILVCILGQYPESNINTINI